MFPDGAEQEKDWTQVAKMQYQYQTYPYYPNGYYQVMPMSPYHEKALYQLQISRQSAMPHHRAKTAAAVSRMSVDLKQSQYDQNAPAIGVSTNDKRWTVLDLGGLQMRNISKELFQYEFLTALYLNNNAITFLPKGIKRLKCLVLLDASGNKLTTLPAEIGMLPRLQSLFLFDNLLSNLPWELGNLYMLEYLGLEGNGHMAEIIMAKLQKDGTVALIHYLRDKSPSIPAPKAREWRELEPSSEPNCSIFCYNILSERYATAKQYGYTPSWALNWKYRGQAILKQIIEYSADVVCLQELELQQYEDFFKKKLFEYNYESIYLMKTRAVTMGEKERKSVDGCAIFFNKHKLELVHKQFIEFSKIAMSNSENEKEVFNRLIAKDNVAILSLFKHKTTMKHFLVANCHIHWDPSFCDVKLFQVIMLLKELEQNLKVYHRLFEINPQQLAVFLCGDFNSTPSSGVHELLSTGKISTEHPDFQTFNYPSVTNTFSHPFHFKSAYCNNPMPFTNFTPTFCDVIDYMWFTQNLARVCGVLEGVDQDYCKKCVGFPNQHFPSEYEITNVVTLRSWPNLD